MFMRIDISIFIVFWAVSSLLPLKTYCRIMSRTIIHLMDRTDPYHIVSTFADIQNISVIYIQLILYIIHCNISYLTLRKILEFAWNKNVECLFDYFVTISIFEYSKF